MGKELKLLGLWTLRWAIGGAEKLLASRSGDATELVGDTLKTLDLAHEFFEEDMGHLDGFEKRVARNAPLATKAITNVSACNALEEGCS